VSAIEQIENVVLGGGEAGKYIAWELARQRRPVIVIERALIGGSCPNVACLPSKNLVHSAKVADLVRCANAYGIPTRIATVDMDRVRQRKRELDPTLRVGLQAMLCAASAWVREPGGGGPA
jgi:pyruvate/2-oxoglutarate dehydrogenase complex dihydrolipoamide dehydrogenase (E3) component